MAQLIFLTCQIKNIVYNKVHCMICVFCLSRVMKQFGPNDHLPRHLFLFPMLARTSVSYTHISS